MKHSRHLPLLLLAGEAATTQPRVFQNLVQHFESAEMGPFIPFVELGFGAAPAVQPITGIFDTGSSDTIVPEAGSEVCQQARQQCTAPAPVVLGQFDPAAAAAAGDFCRLDGQRFNATFGGGDQYDGDYIKTSVVLGQDGQGRVAGAQVALASHSEPQTELPQVPVFGLGPILNEASDRPYNNLPKKMKKAGVTKGQAYSVVLNPTPLGNGSVFFGGIDRAKFEGELNEVPLAKNKRGELPEFVVKMSSVALVPGARDAANNGSARRNADAGRRAKRMPWKRGVGARRLGTAKNTYGPQGAARREVGERRLAMRNNGGKRSDGYHKNRNGDKKNGNGNSNNGSNACNGSKNGNTEINLGLDPRDGFILMDTGGVEMALPAHVVSALAQALGTSFSEDDGLGPVPCGQLEGDAALIMRFQDDAVETRVPLAHMRLSAALADPALTSDGLCQLVVRAVADGGGEGTSVATLPFFAAVYTVFDLDGNRLFFAPAKGDPGAPAAQLEEFP
ncbi:Peptidase catalytic [Cordyceps militaris]|uniref:Peptidase catalytic n=1 Tax=Cordyceps militaris TaxID=73501 RepID=A0A2H4SPB5_CORMI|nr:Peptidase catalytic [Cordyceps militaris]